MAQKALESNENRAQFVTDLYDWLSTESNAVMKCSAIREESDNPLVRLFAEIIQGSSETHIRVLNLIQECLTRKAVSLTPDELGQICDLTKGYMETEKKSVDMAKRAIGNSRIFVIRQLLTCLLDDDSRNLKILEQLEDFKRKMYPCL